MVTAALSSRDTEYEECDDDDLPNVIAADEYEFSDTEWLEITKILQNVLDEKDSASYIGGTLCIEYQNRVLLLNIGNGVLAGKTHRDRNYPLIETMLCKMYLKYKSPNHAFWQYASDIVNKQANP